MADGLLMSRQLIGKSREEITALLGEPPPTGYFDEWDLVYILGPHRALISMDSEWLVVRLGPSGKATEAMIVVD